MEGYIQQAKEKLLKAISEHDGEWGWYKLDRLIDYRKLPTGVDLMTLLKAMERDNLIMKKGSTSIGGQAYGVVSASD